VKAVILAGSPGTRLWPLTRDRPAALLPVANRPVVEHLIEALVRHGVETATLAMHHRPYPVETHLGDGTRLGLRLRYVLERVPLGTAGSVRRAAGTWAEPFVVAVGTTLTSVDFSKVAAFHQGRRAGLTLVVTPAAANDGPLELGEAGEVSLAPTRRAGGYRPTGLAVLSPEALRRLPPADRPTDLLADLVPRLQAAGLPVLGWVTRGPVILIRTLAELLEANRRALSGEIPGLVLPGVEVEPGIRLCRGARIRAGARLSPPVLVGTHAMIDRGAVVAGSVIGPEVIVDPGSTVRDSLVLPRTHLGGGLRVERAVLDPEGVGHTQPSRWVEVRDARLLGDTRPPGPAGGAAGRLAAALLVALTAPVWLLALLALALEARGRLFCTRRVVGARGTEVALRSLAVRGRWGRTLSRLGVKRLPYVWSVLRGDLHWVGTTPRTPAEIRALRARGERWPAPPGLVTLPQFARARLRRDGRLALDRLYAETRSRALDLRLLRAAVLRDPRSPEPVPPGTAR
jgi:NDP-sugar pyrophosphorylase family protein